MAVIIKVTAAMAMPMPNTTFVVSGSPNISVPTSIAVIGSNTPSTDAFVAPILRVEMARVAVDTIVGSRASPMRLSQSVQPDMLAVIAVPLRAVLPKKIIAPTLRV